MQLQRTHTEQQPQITQSEKMLHHFIWYAFKNSKAVSELGFSLGARFTWSDNHSAVGEHGFVETIQEHVLQSMEEVDISHSRSVAAEHMRHLQANTENERNYRVEEDFWCERRWVQDSPPSRHVSSVNGPQWGWWCTLRSLCFCLHQVI